MGKVLAQASATVGKLNDGTDGKTSYIHIAYANSADGSTNFSTTDATGRAYIGTLTDFIEADSTNYADYTWSLAKGADGKDGADGIPGKKGADGKTSYIHFAYANSADGSSNFSTTDPAGKAYVGTLTDFTEADSTNYVDYTWSLIKGADGKNGATGAQGPKGADGRTSYIHVAYANSANGSASFSTTDPTGRAYVGTLTDFVEQDSTNYADYTWSLIKGSDGKDGANGLPGPKGDSVTVTSTSIQYAISTSGTSTPTQWSNSMLAPEQGKFLWTRTTVTFSDGKSAVSYSIAFSGSDGKAEDLSAIISSNTPPESPKNNQFWNDTSVVPNMLKVYRAGTGWVVYQFSAENIASRAITTDKLSANAVKAANIDMSEVTYQVADSSKNLTKNSAFSDEAGNGNSEGWTLPSGVTVVKNALGDTNGILIPAGTTATLVNNLWDATDAISDYVLGLWLKSTGAVTVTVEGATSILGGTNPINLSGDGNWAKREVKYTSTAIATQLKITVKAISDTYLSRVMLARRDTKLDGMWLPAPEDGMLNTSKLNDQVTQNFSLSNGQLKSIISNLNSGYSSNFTQNSDGTINQITKGNDLVTAINTSPAGVYIKGSKIQLDGTVSVTQDFYAKGGNFKNLNADNFTSGKVKADYIDVATVVAQGLSTTNATIEKTLTMGNDGLITANLQTQTLTYTDLNPITGGVTSYPYTSTGTYKLDKTGFTISSKAVFEGNRPIVNVGGHPYRIKTYEPKLYMNDASITLSSSNATGQETSQTTDGTSIAPTVVSITPYVISMSGGGQYTRLFTNGLSTSGMISGDTLYVSPTNVKYMITMSKGNITMQGMASDGSRTKSLRTAHRQWPAWFAQKFDIFREGDMVYGTVMQRARQDIPRDTVSDESLPVGYRPIWQDSVVNIVNYIGRDTGVVIRPSGKLATVGTGMAPYTERWSFSFVTADPFPFGDIYGQ